MLIHRQQWETWFVGWTDRLEVHLVLIMSQGNSLADSWNNDSDIVEIAYYLLN